MSDHFDLTAAAVVPFDATPAHETLQGLVGSWQGPTSTWLDPTAPPDESVTVARIESILGGRFVRLEYHGTVAGKPHAGHMIFGYDHDEKRYTVHWIDSFHMGPLAMLSTGVAGGDGSISVLGSYGYDGQRWGWRTVFERQPTGELLWQACNISPEGQEDRAIETRLQLQ